MSASGGSGEQPGCDPTQFVRKVHFSFGFFDATMPAGVAKHVQATRDANPDFEVTVWGPDQALQLMETHFPALVPTYRAMPYAIQRSDMSRYAILWVHGGMYADLDYQFTKPLAQVLCAVYGSGTINAFVNETPNASKLRRRASNSLMGSRAPGHPFWAAVLRAVTRGWGLSRRQIVLSSAGPQAVDRALTAWRRSHGGSLGDVALLPKRQFNPCSVCNRNSLNVAAQPHVLAYHTNGGSWHSADTAITNTLYCDWPWAVVTGILLVLTITFLVLWVLGRKKGSRLVY